ncbi:hypothetical protein [Pseudomonas pseudonitroreducens]|uniref:hypothetical protein n=1 Tax=Pseudomonas pseudonitroreducens TaxID=2892326 RepID=UPI001F323CE5|nr:hypothetical protein [Pseudomonas pseudonitroreducens]
MGEVIGLPNSYQRAWRGVSEGYREILREDGYSEKSIKEIIDELAPYWDELFADDGVDICIPGELDLTGDQLEGVRQAAEKGVNEFLERNRHRQYRANATMLWLIAWRVGK